MFDLPKMVFNLESKDNFDTEEDSFWLKLQETFNETTNYFILHSKRDTVGLSLIFVLDDEKIHFDALNANWDSTKKSQTYILQQIRCEYTYIG